MSSGVIHLVRTQHFPKNLHFLPPDTHMYVYVRFAYVLNGWHLIALCDIRLK